MIVYQCAKSQSTITAVEGLHFPQSALRPAPTAITTIIPFHEDDDHPRFPAVEHVLGTRNATRECRVTVHSREFIVFYQHDADALVPNQALNSVIPESNWRGELLVMSRGTKHLVKNLRGKEDKRLALLAIERYVIFFVFIVSR